MLILTALASPLHATAELEHSPAIEQAITTAIYQYDTVRLEDLAANSQEYNQAYALYRLAQVNMQQADKKHSAQALKKAKGILNALDDPEAQVLKAGVISLLMGAEPHNAKGLVVELQQAFDGDQQGTTLARAQLLKAINLMYTPPAYGGSIEQAVSLLKQAAGNFQKGPTTVVSWGEPEVYIWLGKAYRQQGNVNAAKSAFAQALELAPQCHWAANELSQLDGL
ncbi:MAG TPA: tetratricopeptide repeat protein [Marinagarivorans sp.]